MSITLRIAAGTAVVAATLAFHGVASAHSNTVICTDQTTSTWRITNDYPLAESFTSPQGPAGTVAAGNGSYTDVVYVGDSLQIDAVWTDGFTESRTGTGDCTPEHETTTTVHETTTSEVTTSSPTTTPTTEPSTSTSEVTTSTVASTVPLTSTSMPGTTIPATTTPSTLPSTTSTSPPAPTTTPECTDNPNTPTDGCAPVCTPVTQPDGTNSCYRLPATGADVGWLIPAATLMLLAGATTIICGRRR